MNNSNLRNNITQLDQLRNQSFLRNRAVGYENLTTEEVTRRQLESPVLNLPVRTRTQVQEVPFEELMRIDRVGSVLNEDLQTSTSNSNTVNSQIEEITLNSQIEENDFIAVTFQIEEPNMRPLMLEIGENFLTQTNSNVNEIDLFLEESAQEVNYSIDLGNMQRFREVPNSVIERMHTIIDESGMVNSLVYYLAQFQCQPLYIKLLISGGIITLIGFGSYICYKLFKPKHQPLMGRVISRFRVWRIAGQFLCKRKIAILKRMLQG